MAEQVAAVFTEVIVAPAYEDGAVEVLRPGRTSGSSSATDPTRSAFELRQLSGGVLQQLADRFEAPGTTRPLDAGGRHGRRRRDLADLAFAWKACRSVKSNAILLA